MCYILSLYILYKTFRTAILRGSSKSFVKDIFRGLEVPGVGRDGSLTLLAFILATVLVDIFRALATR